MPHTSAYAPSIPPFHQWNPHDAQSTLALTRLSRYSYNSASLAEEHDNGQS